jgi:hypothetical protein
LTGFSPEAFGFSNFFEPRHVLIGHAPLIHRPIVTGQFFVIALSDIRECAQAFKTTHEGVANSGVVIAFFGYTALSPIRISTKLFMDL